MTRYDRAEIAEFVQKWIDANAECERNKDWPLAEFYAEDATYGWNWHQGRLHGRRDRRDP